MCYERELNRRLYDYLDSTGADDDDEDVIECAGCEGRAPWDGKSRAWICEECGRRKGLDDDIDDEDYDDCED